MNPEHQRWLIQRTKERLPRFKEPEIRLFPILKGGSDRSFHRAESSCGESFILMHYTQDRQENHYFADIARFLHEIKVPVPHILEHSQEERLLWMEDLGNTDLHSLHNLPWKDQKAAYVESLKAIHKLHTVGLSAWTERKIQLMPGFDHELYSWERHYFLREFINRVCGITLSVERASELEHELAGLANRLISAPPVLIHRDFQSQNIIIRNESAFLIDFQGMRKGAAAYDLGSLLFDPYRQLTSDQREELLQAAFELTGEKKSEFKAYRNQFHEASAQRLMQALGAYGFLGLSKGKRHYLDYIPAGLTHLRCAAANANSLPCLLSLVEDATSAYLTHGA